MYKIYVIKEGETISTISNNLGITKEELIKINGFSSDYEGKENEQIIVPNVSRSPFFSYIVKQGDHLYQIAKEYDVNVDELATLNGLESKDYIYPGQQILVPKKNIKFYITKEGDTVEKIKSNFPNDFEQIFRTNTTIYLLPDQVLVYEKK